MAHEITDEFVASLHASSDSARAVARNAVSHAGVEPVAFDRAQVVAPPPARARRGGQEERRKPRQRSRPGTGPAVSTSPGPEKAAPATHDGS